MVKVINTNWRRQTRDPRTGKWIDTTLGLGSDLAPATPPRPRAADIKRNAATQAKREKLAKRQQLVDRVNATVEAATRDNSVANGGSGGYTHNGGMEMGPDAMLHYTKWLDEYEADGGNRKKPGQAGVAAKIRAINATNPNLTDRQRLVLGDNLPTTKISKKILTREAQESASIFSEEDHDRAELQSVANELGESVENPLTGETIYPQDMTAQQARDAGLVFVEDPMGVSRGRWMEPEDAAAFDPIPRQGYDELGPGPGPGQSMAESAPRGSGSKLEQRVKETLDTPLIQSNESHRVDYRVDGMGEVISSYESGSLDEIRGRFEEMGFQIVGSSPGLGTSKPPTYLVSARGQGVVEEHDSLSEAQRAADFYEGGSVTEVPGTPARSDSAQAMVDADKEHGRMLQERYEQRLADQAIATSLSDPGNATPSGYHDMPVAGHRTYRGGAWTIDTGQLQDGRWAADFSGAAGSPGVGGYQRQYFDTEEEAVAAAKKFLGIEDSISKEESALEEMATDNNQKVIDSANAAGLASSVPQELDYFDESVKEIMSFNMAASAFSDLGWSVQEQLEDYLEDPERTDLNPNAVRMIEDFLDEHSTDGLNNLLQASFDVEAWKEYDALGSSVQEQMESILNGEPFSEQNPNALEMVRDFLRRGMGFEGNKVANQIGDYLDSIRTSGSKAKLSPGRRRWRDQKRDPVNGRWIDESFGAGHNPGKPRTPNESFGAHRIDSRRQMANESITLSGSDRSMINKILSEAESHFLAGENDQGETLVARATRLQDHNDERAANDRAAREAALSPKQRQDRANIAKWEAETGKDYFDPKEIEKRDASGKEPWETATPPAKVVKDWYKDFPGRNYDGSDHDGVEMRISKQPDGSITQIRQVNEDDETYAPVAGAYGVSYNRVDERGVMPGVMVDDRTRKVSDPNAKPRWETYGRLSKEQALAVEAMSPEIAEAVAKYEAESQSYGNVARLTIKPNPDGTLTLKGRDWEATVGTPNSKSLDLQFYDAAFAEVELALSNAGMNTKNGSDWTLRRLEKAMAQAEKIPDRGKLSDDQFANPEDRSYPIPDEPHAKLALGRCKGTPHEDQVRAAVIKKFPQLREYAAQVLDGKVPANEY